MLDKRLTIHEQEKVEPASNEADNQMVGWLQICCCNIGVMAALGQSGPACSKHAYPLLLPDRDNASVQGTWHIHCPPKTLASYIEMLWSLAPGPLLSSVCSSIFVWPVILQEEEIWSCMYMPRSTVDILV